jgi:multisubunit Na+/H+ antiporter MnhG subunit
MQFGKILLCQSVGFLAIIALSWFDEIIGLRSLIFGNNPYISDFRESAFEMLIVLVVWFLVAGTTKRLLKRVAHLEKYLNVCAWCHRVGTADEWMTFEEFVERKFHTPTSHGICEDCREKHRADLMDLAAKQPSLPLGEIESAPRAH